MFYENKYYRKKKQSYLNITLTFKYWEKMYEQVET